MIVIKTKMAMRMLSLETIVCMENATVIMEIADLVFLEGRKEINPESDAEDIVRTKIVDRTIGTADATKAAGGAWDGMTHHMETGVSPDMKILARVVWDISLISRLLEISLHGKIMDRVMVNKVHHMDANTNSMVVRAMLSDNLVIVSNGLIVNGADSLDTRIILMDNSMVEINLVVMVSKDIITRAGDSITRDNKVSLEKDNMARAKDNMDKVGDNNIIRVNMDNMVRAGVSKIN